MDVSVLIPTYKNSETLVRAVKSVLDQDFGGTFEVIVVDDNNPDDEFRRKTEVVMSVFDSNENVIYIKHDRNRNGAAARNTGFKNSKGRYICLLDDDDVFLQGKLEKQVKYMDDHPEFGGSYTWRKQSFGEEVKYTKTGNLEQDILLLDFFPTTITLMIRRECYESLNGFDESFRRHQDFEFLLRFFQYYEMGVVEEVLSQIIGKESQGNQVLGKDYEELKKRFLQTFEPAIQRIESKNPGFKKRVYANHYSDVFVSHIASKHYILAINLLIRGTILYGNVYFLGRIVAHYRHAVCRRYGNKKLSS